MKSPERILLFFCLAMLIMSCERESDSVPPVVEYLAPEPLSLISLPDTLTVKANITDDKVLKLVVLNLLNENKIPCVMGQYYYPETKDFLLNSIIPLEDKGLKSGLYEIQIVAFDGENTNFEYREIELREIQLAIDGYIVLTAPLGFTTNVFRLNNDFSADTQLVIPETFHLCGIHSSWQEFFFVTGEPSVITAYDPESFQVMWEVHAAPPRPEFTGIFPDADLLFATANGDAGIISGTGNIILRTPVYPDMTITHIAADENYIYTAHRSLSGDIDQLTVYYRITGFQMDERKLPVAISGLAPLESSVLVFMNESPGIQWAEYDPEELTLTYIDDLPQEILKGIEMIPEYRMFLLTERCVMVYNYLTGQISDFTDQPYDFCRYDEYSDVVFMGKDKTVTGIALLTGSLVKEIEFQDKVVDFQILYNK